MSFPYDQLTDDERVLVEEHPHWKTMLLPLAGSSLVLIACGWLAALTAGTELQQVAWIALGVLAAAAALHGLGTWLRRCCTHFVITDARVMFREGVLARNAMNIPLSRIASVRTEIDLNDRLFGCGSLVIESLSDQPLRFTDIPAVDDVHTALYQAVDGSTDHIVAIA